EQHAGAFWSGDAVRVDESAGRCREDHRGSASRLAVADGVSDRGAVVGHVRPAGARGGRARGSANEVQMRGRSFFAQPGPKGGRRSKSTSGTNWALVVQISSVPILLALWWFWPRATGVVIEPRADRNVLLISIDTLRADALGSYGGRAITPNLDRLAAHGARFTFAHAQAVVTPTSHARPLTGPHPYQHRLPGHTRHQPSP